MSVRISQKELTERGRVTLCVGSTIPWTGLIKNVSHKNNEKRERRVERLPHGESTYHEWFRPELGFPGMHKKLDNLDSHL